MKDLKDLREKRGQLLHEARQIMDKAESEKRGLTTEEKEKYDRVFNEQAEIGETIKREEQLNEAERRAAERAGKDQEDSGQKGQKGSAEERAALQATAFRNFLKSGRVMGDGAEEFRALQVDADTQGGFLVAPQQFVMNLIKFVDDMVYIRNKATKFQVPTAASLGAASLDTDVNDCDWTVELKTGSEDTGLAFGKRELTPHPLAKRVKISAKLLMMALMDPAALVTQRLGYKFGLTEEKAFLTGDGNKKPLGLFTASANGISTARDVSTSNTTTAITFDGLIEAKYSLKSQYQGTAEWMFHRDAIKQISKIKDNDGQYIWQPSVIAGQQDLILGRPLTMSEHVPNTFTAGKYVGLFGDLSFYWIADALDMQIQRLNELYAETNQVGFIGRKETDGMPVLEEAFARVKLA